MEELRPLFEEFKALNPQIFEEWRERELRGDITPGNDLRNVSREVREFLKTRTDWNSNAALTGAFADFRRIMGQILFYN